MEKKLTAQGPKNRKSYTVTLPLDWVKVQGLDKSRKIDLQVVGAKVVLSAGGNSERVLINLNDYPHTVIKVLQGLYRQGVNEVKLEYKDSAQLTEVNRLLGRLMGYEIIEHTKDYIIIKDITKESSEDFDTVLRRIFLLALELTNSRETEQIASLDVTIKKLVNYGQRILVQQGHAEYQKVPFYFVLLDRLEKLADEYGWILASPLNREQRKQLMDINRATHKLYELYYKFNASDFDEYEYLTYQLRRKMRLKPQLDAFDLHAHNVARMLNTMYGTIFSLRHTGKTEA